MLDLIVENGLVFDGRGSPPSRASVGVKDGRVAAIGPAVQEPARERIDASGLWVTPGFLDIHTHYDIEVEVAPGLAESVRHGVTSVVMGNCSLSLAVGEPATLAEMFLRVETFPRPLIEKWLARSVTWSSPASYLEHLASLPLGPSVAPLLGHSSLRAHVMGLARSLSEEAAPAELEEMRRIASAALDAGCIGISIDMLAWHRMSGEHRGKPIPSHHASFEEYAMLAQVCRERDAVFQVTPNAQDWTTLLDVFRLSVGQDRPLRLTVLAALDSAVHRRMWRAFPIALPVWNRLFGANVRFQTLTEPFAIYADGPITPVFEEFASGVLLNDRPDRSSRAQLWSSAGFRERFRADWRPDPHRAFHRDLGRMTTVRAPDATLTGKTFGEAARERGADPLELFMDLLERYDTELRWVATGANDRLGPRLALMRNPHILPGFTDAGAHVQHLGYYDGALSLLRQAASTGFLSPERAIQRVTGEPAEWFRVDAGVLRPGARADFLLLDPNELSGGISPMLEVEDPLLEGARRVVKRGSDRLLAAVYIAGRCAVRQGALQSALGTERLGQVLSLRPPSQEPISEAIPDHPFSDYWDVFVLKHQHPGNIALHVVAVAMIYTGLASALALGSPWLLLLVPLSQLTGLLGHYLFEPSHIDTRDAVFSLRASRSLNRMFAKVLSGTYFTEVRRLRSELDAYLARQRA